MTTRIRSLPLALLLASTVAAAAGDPELSPEVVVAVQATGHTLSHVATASSDGSYLATWLDLPATGPQQIEGRILSAAGDPQGPGPFVISTEVTPDTPQVAAVNAGWMVTYPIVRGSADDDGHPVHYVVVSSDGSVGSVHPIPGTSINADTPRLAGGLLVYVRTDAQLGWDIVGVFLDAPIEFVIHDDGPQHGDRGFNPAVAVNDAGDYFVTWSNSSTLGAVFGRTISGWPQSGEAGNRGTMGPEFQLTQVDCDASQIAAGGSRYLVTAFCNDFAAHGVLVEGSGTMLPLAGTEILSGSNLWAAWEGIGFVVAAGYPLQFATFDPDLGPTSGVQQVTPTGVPIRTTALASDGDGGSLFVYAELDGVKARHLSTLTTCDPGTADCNDDRSDGCEEADSDLDSIGDGCDTCPDDAANDIDADGVCGGDDDCPTVADAAQADADADGSGDVCDACPNDISNDADGDGFCADVDNCPSSGNDQVDSDGDGLGDACDVCRLDAANDADGDGICADQDNCPTAANSDQSNTDGDGAGDACDPDDDDDGIADPNDNCAKTYNPLQTDFDLDGTGDSCDSDDDGDGVLDGTDSCPNTAPGAIHDASGCSLADLVPCSPSGGAAWKNHGAYVSAVTQKAQAFVNAGLITTAQKSALVTAAAASQCGR